MELIRCAFPVSLVPVRLTTAVVSATETSLQLYLDPRGNDAWSVRTAAMTQAGNDRPFTRLVPAQQAVRHALASVAKQPAV